MERERKKGQHHREITDAQTARIPEKSKNPMLKFNPEEQLVFKSEELTTAEIESYLEFCRKIFPCRSSRLGGIFTEDINVQNALEILHKCNYDVAKAKFQLTFPTLNRYSQIRNIKLDAGLDFRGMIQDFTEQKPIVFSNKEKSFFDELNNRLIERKTRTSYKEIEEILAEGVKKRFSYPEPLKTELARCETASSEIVQCLRDLKSIPKIEALFIKCNSLMIIPKNIDDLVQTKLMLEDMLEKAREFLKGREKDIKIMNKLISDIKTFSVDVATEPVLKQLTQFAVMTNNVLDKVTVLSKPFRGKDSGQKYKLTDVFEIMNYFHTYSIKNDKNITDVAYNVYRMEIEKENCLMFVEDTKEFETKNFNNFLDDLRKCSLDYEAEITLIESKIQTIEISRTLIKNIYNESMIEENLKKVESFEKSNHASTKQIALDMKNSLINLQKIERKINELGRRPTPIFDYLSGKHNLMDATETISFIQQLKIKNQQFFEMPLVQKAFKSICAFEADLKTFDVPANSDLRIATEKLRLLLSHGWENMKLIAIKNRIVNALEIEYFIVKLLEKFTAEKLTYNYEEFEPIVCVRVQPITNFDAGALVAKADLDKLHNSQLKQTFLNYFYKREEINFALSANAAQILNDLAIQELEESIKSTFRDKDLFKRIQTISDLRKVRNLHHSLDNKLKKDYVAHDALFGQMSALEGNFSLSQEFFAAHIFEFFSIYHQALSFKEEISTEKLDEITTWQSRPQSEKNDVPAEFFNRLKLIRDIMAFNCDRFYEIMKEDAVEGRYVLKVLNLIMLIYKTYSLGIQPEFCKRIQYIVDNYIEIELFLNPLNKKTLREIQHYSVKQLELKLYSPTASILKAVSNLAVKFKKSVAQIHNQVNGNTTTTIEVMESIDKHVELKQYDVDLFEETIMLGKKKFDILENTEFANFLNAGNKKIRKNRSMTDYDGLNESESQEDDAAVQEVIPTEPNESGDVCICREVYKTTDMIKFANCDEIFHQRCVQIPNNLEETTKKENCLACSFLEQASSESLGIFKRKKISSEDYKEILKSFYLLKQFLLDRDVEFIGSLAKKSAQLIKEIENCEEFIQKNEAESAKKSLHVCALLYIYIPVQLADIERKIIELHGQIKALE